MLEKPEKKSYVTFGGLVKKRILNNFAGHVMYAKKLWQRGE